jgi:hypothetical protein
MSITPEPGRTVRVGRQHVAAIDAADHDQVSAFAWFIQRNASNVIYARADVVGPDGRRRKVFMHRLICPEFARVDHRDGDGLNNRRCNLRDSTASTNGGNRKKQRGATTSRFKGVYLAKDKRRWRSAIRLDGRWRGLGHFDGEADAARAYDAAALEAWGEFARPNFPEER